MRWINRYNETKTIKRKIGSGRKGITSLEKDKIIIDKVSNNNDITIANIQKEIINENINISVGTIYNRIIENDFKYKFPITKPLLTESRKEKRLEWAKKYKNQNWNNIIFGHVFVGRK